MVGLIDLMPTMLSLAGVMPPEGLHGRDVSPLLGGKRVERPELFYASGTMWAPQAFSVRTERHRLLVNRVSGETQLYDLEADPTEQTDLSDQEPELSATMLDLLEAHLSTRSVNKLDAQTREVEEETLEKLRSLGYVD